MSSKKSKWMYHFSVPKKVKEQVEIDPIKDDEGNEIKQVKTITKTTPLKCAILKPTRKLFEEGELYYSVELSKYIQAGLLTKTLLAKRFANDGGVLTEDDQKHYSELYSSLTAKEQKIQRLQLDASLSSKKRAKKLQELIVELTMIRQQLVEFESVQSALFDQTAEHKAKNKTIMWWVLNLSYVKNNPDEEWAPLFKGEDYDQKIESYDEFEEGEEYKEGGEFEYVDMMVKKFAYFTSFWYTGQAGDKETFDQAAQLLEEVDIFDDNPATTPAQKAEKASEKATELAIEAQNEMIEGMVEELEGGTPPVKVPVEEVKEAETETKEENKAEDKAEEVFEDHITPLDESLAEEAIETIAEQNKSKDDEPKAE